MTDDDLELELFFRRRVLKAAVRAARCMAKHTRRVNRDREDAKRKNVRLDECAVEVRGVNIAGYARPHVVRDLE